MVLPRKQASLDIPETAFWVPMLCSNDEMRKRLVVVLCPQYQQERDSHRLLGATYLLGFTLV
jgi:hypothetical protein